MESAQYNGALAIIGAIQEPFRAPLVISCIKNRGLHTSNKKDRWSFRVCSINSFLPRNHHISIIYFHKWNILTDTPILSILFLVELNTSKTVIFYISLMNAINLIETFIALVIIIFFALHFLPFNAYCPKIVRHTLKILQHLLQVF